MKSLPYLGFESLERLREVADALPDGLFTTDLDGRVTWWNRAAEQITGWTRAEALGQSCSILAGDPVNGCACGDGPIRCGMIDKGKSSKCCTVRTRDGRLRTIVKNAVGIYAPDGSPVGALESFTDVGAVPGLDRRQVEFDRSPGPGDFCSLVGRHTAMKDLYRMIELVARSDSTVMILGESGAGKERVAEAIHRMSPRADGPFVRVSCSALNENLLESELFGHVKGAFTGALRDRRGRFQEADGGTLLLDEIGDISPVVQVKLLRVIEQREVERVGDSAPIKVNVRLVCATHRDLKRLVAEGKFRADLFFRLAVFPLRVPSLREHTEDVPLLAERCLSRLVAPGEPPRPLSQEALERLQAYSWPGNVREFQNAIEYAWLQAAEGPVLADHLPPDVRDWRPGAAASAAAPPVPPSEEEERRRIEAALAQAGGARARAAAALGISRVTLWKRMKKYGMGTESSEH